MAGVWGCPPGRISTPFLARKGVREMVERVFQQPRSWQTGDPKRGSQNQTPEDGSGSHFQYRMLLQFNP